MCCFISQAQPVHFNSHQHPTKIRARALKPRVLDTQRRFQQTELRLKRETLQWWPVAVSLEGFSTLSLVQLNFALVPQNTSLCVGLLNSQTTGKRPGLKWKYLFYREFDVELHEERAQTDLWMSSLHFCQSPGFECLSQVWTGLWSSSCIVLC